MRKLFFTMAAMALVAISCQKEVNEVADSPPNSEPATESYSQMRSYEEALSIAEDALNILGDNETRGSKKRTIKRNEGQIVTRAITRGGESSEEPILYIFNNEDDTGFTIIAANKSVQPVVAVTESGNYTYGEPTGVESFDLHMENVASTYAIITPPTIPLPEPPLVPKPALYYDTINIYNRIEPLLTTKWDQGGVFGEYCDNGFAGCAATAVAQVLAHHRHPDQLTLTYSNNETISLDWDDILKHKKGNLNQSTCYCSCSNHTKMSHLLREVGERMDMKYLINTISYADPRDVGGALSSLGYTTPILSTNVNGQAIKNTIRWELEYGNPVIIFGEKTGKEIGHCWIIDGYHYWEHGVKCYVENPEYDPTLVYPGPEYIYSAEDSHIEIEKMYHINWGGERGVCNGWFDMICYDANNGIEYDKLVGTSCNLSAFDTIHVLYNIEPIE